MLLAGARSSPLVTATLVALFAGAAHACSFDLGRVEPGTGEGARGGGSALGGGGTTGTTTSASTHSTTSTSTTSTAEAIDPYECTSCLGSQCASDAAACDGQVECAALSDCWLQCLGPIGGDAWCIHDCIEAHPGGYVPMLEYMECWVRGCHDECLSPGCSVWRSSWDPDLPGCLDCIATHCGPECTACEQDYACVKLAFCKYYCRLLSTSCPTDCEATYAAGQEQYDAMWAAGACSGADDCSSACYFM